MGLCKQVSKRHQVPNLLHLSKIQRGPNARVRGKSRGLSFWESVGEPLGESFPQWFPEWFGD